MSKSKTNSGYFFEDFKLGMSLPHATPRTITEGEIALYTALYGTRFVMNSSSAFAQSVGLPDAPIDDLLVFHIVFGKTVPDVSLNAVANLGYADCRFLLPVYAGDTLFARSEVIGLKENSNGKTGVVYVRSTGTNQMDEKVLEYVRWVMVNKRDAQTPAATASIPELPEVVSVKNLSPLPETLDLNGYDTALSGSSDLWEDYAIGEKIDHVDGMTIEEAEHMLATRLYQNTAKVHFDQFAQAKGRFGKRLIYGGHVISLARSLSFNGLANAFHLAAINAGRHVNPCFAGDTVYAWSEIIDKAELAGRTDAGALRVRTIAAKNHPCSDFPQFTSGKEYQEDVILDLDYWLIMPRRP